MNTYIDKLIHNIVTPEYLSNKIPYENKISKIMFYYSNKTTSLTGAKPVVLWEVKTRYDKVI